MMRKPGWRLAALLPLLFLAGCLTPPTPIPLPAGLSLEPVAAGLLPRSPTAVSADGTRLAVVRATGLYLRPLVGAAEERLSPDAAVALAFSRDGDQLAAAFALADGSGALVRFATSDGTRRGELALPGRCEAILTQGRDWLIFVTTLKPFRFGANLHSRMLRWNGVDPPVEEELNDATLDPATLAAGPALLTTLRPRLSPFNDEILFWRLHDPPAFAPNLRLIRRHLASANELALVTLPGLNATAAYLDGGAQIVYGDGVERMHLLDPVTNQETGTLRGPGRDLATPPAGDLLWADQVLWRRNGERLLSFSRPTEPVAFLPAGRAIVRSGDRLWLLSGLPVSPAPPVADEKLLRLRRWLAEGLITAQEYQEQVQGER